MKLALFKSNYGTTMAFDADEAGYSWADDSNDYVRISGCVDVEFPMLDSQEVVKNQIAVIDTKIDQLNLRCHEAVKELKRQKQELLALPSK